MKSSRHIYLSSDNPMESLIEASVRCLLAVNPCLTLWLILISLKALPCVPMALISQTSSHWNSPDNNCLLTGTPGTSHTPGPAGIREEDLANSCWQRCPCPLPPVSRPLLHRLCELMSSWDSNGTDVTLSFPRMS